MESSQITGRLRYFGALEMVRQLKLDRPKLLPIWPSGKKRRNGLGNILLIR